MTDEQISGERINKKDWIIILITTLIAIVLLIVSIIIGPKVYYYFFGNLNIDYKEDSIFSENGTSYAKIEIQNDFGQTLTNVKGNVSLNCSNISYYYFSDLFELPGDKEFLGVGGNSEFLISPDPLFVNLVETKKYQCADAQLEWGDYSRLNESYSKLDRAVTFKFFLKDEEINITKEERNNEQISFQRICVYCNVNINVQSSEKNFSKSETHKFVSGTTSIYPFPKVYPTPRGLAQDFNSLFGNRLLSFKPCRNISQGGCNKFLCYKVKDVFSEFNPDCERLAYAQGINMSLFSNQGAYMN